MRKIGILGGSFDPIHKGHLNIAESARREFELDNVWFIPAGHSPNKDEQGMTPAVQRCCMVELALADYPYFKCSKIEVEAENTSYTYLTLTKLKERYPDTELYFIMGADSLDYLEKWKHPEIICEKAVILTAVRDDMDIAQICEKTAWLKKFFSAQIYPIREGRTGISSTELREQIKAGVLDPDMLPSQTADYIRKHHLYGYQNKRQTIS